MVLHTILFWLTRHSVTTSNDFAVDTADMPTHVVLSSVAGFLSILCWFIVFTPQLWINYKRQSGESLSLPFLYIWLAGDFFNLAGATMDHLLLTMQILAWYYTVADILLIAQVYYYRRKAAKAKAHAAAVEYDNDGYNELGKGLGITIARSKAQGSAHYPPPPPSFLSASASSDRTLIPEEDEIVEEAGQHRITEPQETTTLLGKPHLSIGSHHLGYRKGYSTIETPASIAAAVAMPGEELSSQERALEQGTLFRTASYATSTESSDTTISNRPLLRRRRVRILLISLPILAIVLFTWSYLKWQDCVLREPKRHGRGQDLDHIQGFQDLDMAGAADEWTLGWRVCRQGRGRDELPPSGPSHVFTDDGDSDGNHSGDSGDSGESGITTALLLGWGGAVLYLGSRIPQIYKNWRLQSCEGLSLMMFIFSVLGNGFYVASIFLDSLEPDYLFRNMPWWLGACGTLVLDFTIFTQFFLYQDSKAAEPTEDD